MEDQKVELPILRRDSGGSNEWPKSGIAYTTARLCWLRWTTKKWNCLYYGEILVVKKVEFPILRRDLGFSNERAKNGITYATARSWGGPKSPKSLTIDGNIEKSMQKYEKGMKHWCNTLKMMKNRWKSMKLNQKWWNSMTNCLKILDLILPRHKDRHWRVWHVGGTSNHCPFSG